MNKMQKAKLRITVLCLLGLLVVLLFVGVMLWRNASIQQTQQPSTPPQSTGATTISFPYAIPGTDLVIQTVRSYDGIYIEDGSNQKVTGISVMVLVNNGTAGIEFADITLRQGDVELRFQASSIPAGATLVVQEASAKKYTTGEYTVASVNVGTATILEMSDGLVKVEEVENGTLLITNLTDEKIPCVRVYYKFAYEKGKVYVGGITYSAEITDLEPGQSKKVTANHFAAGSSEVVMVRTYETAD